jgi:hypothetical protein
MSASHGLVRCFTSLRAESSAIPKEPNLLCGTAGAERLTTHQGSVMMAHSEAGW